MVGSICVSKEGEKPNFRKEEITVSEVKVVTSKYRQQQRK